MMAVISMLKNPKDCIAGKRLKWVSFCRMRLVCTKCTVMFGNGARINGMITIKLHQPMAVLGKAMVRPVGAG